MNEPSAHRKVLLQALRRAGAVIRKSVAKKKQSSAKSPVNLLTDVDRKAEAVLLRTIRASFPDHAILTEESGHFKGLASYTWIVDPLDGTTNYAHQIPHAAV